MANGTRSLVRWALGLLALGAVGTAYWHFGPESRYRAAVRDIAAAQAEYHRRGLAPGGGARYGTRDELVAAGVLKPTFGWTAPAEDAPTERWWAVAGPAQPLCGQFYYTDQSGVVYASWTPIAPRVDRVAGTPPAGLRRVE